MADETDDDGEDLAEFELHVTDANGGEELAAATSGPRARALGEIVHYWHQLGGVGRLCEVVRIPVDLSRLGKVTQ